MIHGSSPSLNEYPGSPWPIAEIASRLGLGIEDWEPYGWHQAKLASDLLARIGNRPQGKYVNVSAINPTPLGEGKTVTAIGLAMALNRLGKSAVATLREPSLGPLFGIKGGSTGDRKSTRLNSSHIPLSRMPSSA